MISINQNRVAALIRSYKKEIDAHAKLIADKLDEVTTTAVPAGQNKYIARLKKYGKKLVTAKPDELERMKTGLNGIITFNPDIAAHTVFKNKILAALDYQTQRSKFYPEYFRKLGIKSCVYCNSQLCVTVEDEAGRNVARFQVDHFIDKGRHPGLSVALYNLYPVCSSCNNKKGIKSVGFKLYADETTSKKSPYSFTLENKDKIVAEYVSKRDPKLIKIKFTEPTAATGEHKLNSIFSIQGIYDTQIDIVEELIIKKHVYNDSYKKELCEKFNALFDEKTFNQLIVGNYLQSSEIHNRPLSKFMQDIARQLELIPEE